MPNANNNLPEIGWPVRNDQIVIMSMLGKTQDEVAKAFDMSRQNVSKILQDPRAITFAKDIRARLQETLLGNMEDQLDLATTASIKVLRRTLDADISPFHKAKPNQDRVALKVLQGRGYLVAETGANNGFQVSPEQFERLEKAIAKSEASKDINVFEAEIEEDSDVEIVEAIPVSNG